MPDDTADAAAAAAPGKKPPPAVNPDRVGEELADDARIWHVYDRVAKEDDERRTKAWDNGLNNLALFAGLFSAVTTAFIIEARHDLEPDYAQLTFLVLNATAFGVKPVHEPFVVAPSARTVNSLWLASLILSLSAALIAIMGKDWIGMYTARPVCNLRQWAELRTYRMLCADRWYMSGVIAAAPVLLHVSLLFFGAGLVLFISSDPLTHHLTLGLSLAAGVLYLVTTLSAVVFSASPFKSPATQIIRAALSAVYSYVWSVIHRPSKPLRTLVGEIHAMFLRRADGTAVLPGGPAEIAHWYSGLLPAIIHAPSAAIVYMRKTPTWVDKVHNNLQRLPARLYSIASAARRLSFDWFLSSTWSDLPTDRRPKLLAEALSWLSVSSEAPDVFRAIVFALGDLDVGPEVGKRTSTALRTRLRAEIRRTWQQVDFPTLSHYVLADRNTPGVPALTYDHFTSRFDIENAPELRCEEGLAAVIMVDPGWILPRDVANYCPDQVAQPRMLDLLLPHMGKPHQQPTGVLILLSNRYQAHLWNTNSFNLLNLERHLYESLDTETRNAYTTATSVKYGGTAGPIELLTFLCCHGVIYDITSPAAVGLVMELLPRLPLREHRCLAYLFGSSDLWDATWKDRQWSGSSIYCLSRSLETSCSHPREPSSVRTLSDDREFDLALAHTSVMLLSPKHSKNGHEGGFIKFLFGYLCQPPSPSILDNDGNLGVIRLILKTAALLRIAGMPEYLRYDDSTVNCGATILAAIISQLGQHLREGASVREREQLFQALVLTEVKGQNGATETWDLGEWLRTQAPEILNKCPSAATALQRVHDALVEVYPLCESNQELRVQWDRIAYPGRPGDIFSDPFLDVGAFFDNAEAPRARPRDIFDDPFLDLAEFFAKAEGWLYLPWLLEWPVR